MAENQKTVAQLLAEATTYNDKVDVLVALAQATVSDKVATEVGDGIALQKAVGESTDDAVLDANLEDAQARVESLQFLRDERDKANKEAAKTADPKPAPQKASASS